MIQGTFFGYPNSTLLALQTTWLNALTAVASTGQSYSIAGRSLTRANTGEIMSMLAELQAAIDRNNGVRTTQTYALFTSDYPDKGARGGTPTGIPAPAFISMQKGNVPIVGGQREYPVIFPVPFSSAPGQVLAGVLLAGPAGAGEAFGAFPDATTITALGVTIWLDGIPEASGGYITWQADL